MINKLGTLKIAVCAAFLALGGAAFFFPSAAPFAQFRTNAADDAVNPQNCAACHQENYASWHRTSHRQTIKKATAETVRGDFIVENRLEYAGVNYEMTRDEGNFFIKIGDQSYQVEAVVGAKYIEQYVGAINGELTSLPIGYDLTEKRWRHLNETDFAASDADPARHSRNWKTDCAACHRSGENDLASGFDEFGITCAACHGSAAGHLEAQSSWRARLGLSVENKIVNPQNLSSDAAMMVCAQCHDRDAGESAHREASEAEKNPNEPISAHQTGDGGAEKYWADGSNKYSGNEYQAILRSVCYQQSKAGGHGIAGEKINCASCHSSHETPSEIRDEAAPAARSANQSCINCHAQFAGDAAIVEHTRHPLNSEAISCASCHQPEIVYERGRFVATHEISVPNPRLTVEQQVPNACNLCHTEQSVNWAIASSKELWAERFRGIEISRDRRYDQPESLRALTSDDALTRALAADARRKHPTGDRTAPLLFEVLKTEKLPLVVHFLNAALGRDTSNSPDDWRTSKMEKREPDGK